MTKKVNMSDKFRMAIELYDSESQLDWLVEEIRKLRTEVNCRIEHGAESGGHLEYVQSRLDDLLPIPLA